MQTLVISGAGHWLAKQAPDQLAAALTEVPHLERALVEHSDWFYSLPRHS